jgi:glycogen(starch) synthase
VVSTEPEGMAYVVEHGRTGLLSAPGDAQALAENVIRLLQNGELAERLAANAREQIQTYSWAPVREQWLGLYRNLLSRDARAVEELAAAGVDRTQP